MEYKFCELILFLGGLTSLGRAPSLRRWCNADSRSDWASDGVRVDEGLRAVTVILEGCKLFLTWME
jgi:hypothetical protein